MSRERWLGELAEERKTEASLGSPFERQVSGKWAEPISLWYRLGTVLGVCQKIREETSRRTTSRSPFGRRDGSRAGGAVAHVSQAPLVVTREASTEGGLPWLSRSERHLSESVAVALTFLAVCVIVLNWVGEPDAVILHVRFDERGVETG